MRITVKLCDDDFITQSIEKFKDHSSITGIQNNTNNHCDFTFKEANASQVETILGNLNTHKAT